MSGSVTPFTVSVPDATLADLRDRLRRARWTDTIDPHGWQYGVNLEYLEALVRHWLEKYDWRAQERAINSLPHFTAEIDGASIHFVHQRGSGARRVPLLVTHGWPGSFLEMVKILPLLAESFDVIVPSIPGFGFSSKPTAAGVNAWKTADWWAELMTVLGYERFVVQGGDFGASIGTALALRHKHRVEALHLNYIPGSYVPPSVEDMSAEERDFRAGAAAWYDEEGAYAHVHATRPQTIGLALNDSPIGLAAWLLEKYRAWSDCGGDVETRFTRDEIITHIMIYWVTGTIHASMRFYNEMRRAPMAFGRSDFVDVPVGISHFAGEAPFPPRSWIARGYNIVQWSDHARGAHFAAWEEPELLAADLEALCRSICAV
jgi:pimeloyl-ACP methyl ester carboxylesterase